MADTKPPKNNKTDAPDIGRRDGSSNYGAMSQECRNLLCDYDDHIRVRSSKQALSDDQGTTVVAPETDTMAFIELPASCGRVNE